MARRKYRKVRPYEQLCDCSAYPFRHRMFGGSCVGLSLCEEAYPSTTCRNCMLCRNGYCEVIEGQESTKECPIVQEFVNYHEIRFYNRRLAK